MKRFILLFVTTVLWIASNADAGALPEKALAGTVSPYLALHVDDPVHWQLWNEQTVALAESLNRPIFISSGYFACHWCHVMQRESFQDSQVADWLNTHFVPVKIDREVDIATDELLIRFMREQSGIAGWPLNVITSPDARPLAGLLYAPPDVLMETLTATASDWPQRLAALKVHDLPSALNGGDVAAQSQRDELTEGEWLKAFKAAFIGAAYDQADDLQDGFGDQARFPHVPRLQALLAFAEDYSWVEDFLQLTLDTMADKGLRDHIEGGFFRYTVDPDWETPHFEKMLYDNAQLAALYLLAADALNVPRWREVAFDTLDFMIARLSRQDGGFMSAVSALDEHGREGGDVLWTPAQIGQALSGELVPLAASWFGLHRPPTFQAGHLLIPQRSAEDVAARFEWSQAQAQDKIASMQHILRDFRLSKELVSDDKAVMAWNGLTLQALALAARHDAAYQELGQALSAFLLRHVRDDGTLPRAIDVSGRVLGEGTLEDHVFVASGLLAWHQLTGAPSLQDTARLLIDAAWQQFHDGELWHLEQRPLLRYGVGQQVFQDQVMSSPTAILLSITLSSGAEASDDLVRRASLLRALRAVVFSEALSQGTAISVLLGVDAEHQNRARHKAAVAE